MSEKKEKKYIIDKKKDTFYRVPTRDFFGKAVSF